MVAPPAKQGSLHHWKFFTLHTGPRFAHGFPAFHMYTIIKQNCASIKQKSYKIMRMIDAAAWNMANPGTEMYQA
jgi:hypothetical protein